MPAERVDSILRQSGADDRHRRRLQPPTVPTISGPSTCILSRPPTWCSPPGTTGEPKGVIGTHAAVGAYADDHLDHVLTPAAARLGRPLRIAHAWSFAFDAAWQPLVALLGGHAVHVVDEHTQTDAEALVAAIAEHGVDMIDTTPSMFAQLRAAGLLTRVPLAVLALGGEALGGGAWSFIRMQCRRTAMTAFNCYGPTETTVEAVVAAIDRTRRAVDRAADPVHPRLRAGLRVAPGALRGCGGAVPRRRPVGPRLPGPRTGNRAALRCRPFRRRRTDVSHRRFGAPPTRWIAAATWGAPMRR